MIGVVRVLFEWVWGIPIGEELRAEDLPFPSLCRLLSLFYGNSASGGFVVFRAWTWGSRCDPSGSLFIFDLTRYIGFSAKQKNEHPDIQIPRTCGSINAHCWLCWYYDDCRILAQNQGTSPGSLLH